MSLVPAFRIGAWNAWIFMIWLWMDMLAVKLVGLEVYRRAPGIPPEIKSQPSIQGGQLCIYGYRYCGCRPFYFFATQTRYDMVLRWSCHFLNGPGSAYGCYSEFC